MLACFITAVLAGPGKEWKCQRYLCFSSAGLPQQTDHMTSASYQVEDSKLVQTQNVQNVTGNSFIGDL